MALTTIILSIVALLLIYANIKITGRQYEGLKGGMKQMVHMLPIILAAFILSGMIEVVIPEEFVKEWLSKEAGLRGILLGSFGGMLLAMGPYAFFPIAASILTSGAGLGTIISIITGWCLLSLSKMPFETAFFGMRFFIRKTILSIPFSLAAGLIAHVLEVIFM